MKLSFEAKTFGEILDQMNDVLAGFPGPKSKSTTNSEFVENVAPAKAQGPGPDPFNGAGHVDKPVNNPVDKPVEKTKARTAKQLENDERLRERALAKQAEKKAAKAAKADMGAGIVQPVRPTPPPPKTAEGMDPAEVVKVRQKTIEDLQSAYANGFQKEVFELLSRFGNGAKSFRELPPESFVPIREAIDNGALT